METIGDTIQVEAVDGMVWLGSLNGRPEAFLTDDETTALIAALQAAQDEARGRTGADFYTVTLQDETSDDGEAPTTYVLQAPDFETAVDVARTHHFDAGYGRARYLFRQSFKGRPTQGGYTYVNLMQDETGWRAVGTGVAA